LINGIEAIPPELLGMVAILKKAIGKDDENNIKYQKIDLSMVRIDFTKDVMRNKAGDQINLNGLLFYDETYSFPINAKFEENDIIECIWMGTKYEFKIVAIEPVFAFNRPIYWIIGLV